MPDTPPIVLRYFDARGRAQFIRHYLNARGFEYSEERVPVGLPFREWQAMKGDRARAGPFHKLPVLHWGETTVAETLVINSYLHRVTGDEAALSEQDNLRHAMLFSCLLIDMMNPIGMLIWADLALPGVDATAYARAALARIGANLDILEKTLAEWRWRESAAARRVMLADCLLWEELDLVQHVFGEHARLENRPTLARIHREAPGRDAFLAGLARPAAVTGRGLASEAEILPKIRAAVAG
jgi:glutathione S-transferase